MRRFIVRRLLSAVVLAWAVATGAFLLGLAAQGDYVGQALGLGAREDTAARLRARYALDRPLGERYVTWLGGVARGDLGTSLLYQRPVSELLVSRSAATALLAGVALVIAAGLGLPAGILTGARPRSVAARAVTGVSLVLLSTPSLLAALALVWLAAVSGLFPIGGLTSAHLGQGTWPARLADIAWHLPVPALALGLPLAGVLERVQSQALREALAHPSMLAAAARGLRRDEVVRRHALRLSLAPVLGMGGLLGGVLLGGSFAVEIVTSWPGLGRLTYDALVARDVGLASGCAMAAGFFVGLSTLAADLALAAADPRVLGSSEDPGVEHA